MHLLGHPNSSQMIYDLQQEVMETFSKKLPEITGMDVIEHLAHIIASFNLNHFDKVLALVIFLIILFVVIILLALKCMLIYLHKL